MTKLIRTLGVVLVVGILAAGCDSVVDSDSALTETDVTIQSENSALASEAEVASISSPEMGEVVYENTLHLEGSDKSAVDNNAQWAVRAGTCAAGTSTVAGNVDGYDDDYSWEDGYFAATLDISELEAGEYCFVLTTRQGAAEGNRQSQEFYIVDEYTKVGGNIDNEHYLINKDPDGLQPLRGRQLSNAFSGVVGKAGDAGIVGSVSVNYRQLKESVTYEAESLSFRAAEVADDQSAGNAVAQIETIDGGIILVLDSNSSADYPRGAVIVRPDGGPGDGLYEIDGTPGTGGAESWIPMENGNNHNVIH